MGLRAGDLDNWIVWQRPIAVAGGGSDAAALDWERVCGCWAQMLSTGGLELQMADQMETRLWWQISLRHRLDIDATCRGLFRGTRILNITAIVNVNEGNIEQRVTAWEGLGVQ
jgi:head-tail adaptor